MELDADFFAGVLGRGRVVRCEVSARRKDGTGFIGTMRRATVEAEEDDGRSRTLHLIVKTLPENESLRKVISDLGFFPREIAVYEQTLPDIYSMFLHSGSGIPPHSLAPAMYPCGGLEDVLVLEDLEPAGFRMATGGRQLDLAHCLAALRALAVFHAGSIALFEDDVSSVSRFSELFYVPKRRDYASQFVLPNVRALASAIRSWPGFERFADKIAGLEATVVDRTIQVVKRDEAELSVLNHGDFWVNNILYRYDEGTGAVDKAKLVDFQLCRFSSPALDLNYFLCTSVAEDVRLTHRDRLLDEYLGVFNSTLEALECTSRLSRGELDRQMEARAFYGLLGAFTDLATILAPQDSVSLENFADDGAFDKLYANEDFRGVLQKLLLEFEAKNLL